MGNGHKVRLLKLCPTAHSAISASTILQSGDKDCGVRQTIVGPAIGHSTLSLTLSCLCTALLPFWLNQYWQREEEDSPMLTQPIARPVFCRVWTRVLPSNAIITAAFCQGKASMGRFVCAQRSDIPIQSDEWSLWSVLSGLWLRALSGPRRSREDVVGELQRECMLRMESLNSQQAKRETAVCGLCCCAVSICQSVSPPNLSSLGPFGVWLFGVWSFVDSTGRRGRAGSHHTCRTCLTRMDLLSMTPSLSFCLCAFRCPTRKIEAVA